VIPHVTICPPHARVSPKAERSRRGAAAENRGPNVAHVRQSRPDSGLGFQVKVLENFCMCSLFFRP